MADQLQTNTDLLLDNLLSGIQHALDMDDRTIRRLAATDCRYLEDARKAIMDGIEEFEDDQQKAARQKCAECGSMNTDVEGEQYPTGVVAPDGTQEYWDAEVKICRDCGEREELYSFRALFRRAHQRDAMG